MSTIAPTTEIPDGLRVAEGPAKFLDERLGIAKIAKGNLRKIFPDHWSFLLGEIALYSFVVLLLSGVYLTLFFKPSLQEGVYAGSYAPLHGVTMSDAFASTLRISFDVRGGLLMRQIHHWAALLFLAAMTVHMMRTFFTGAFRKPRELNWVIGATLIIMGILEGFTGYSMPDDLLSGTGLRIAQAIILGIPIVGVYVAYFLFGGSFPGGDFDSRFYSIHILLIPGLILVLITVHLMLVVLQKHTQYPGPGRTENNVVGYPLFPVYMAKAGGFFFVVFGVIALLGALFQINPVWLYGPYDAAQVSAGSQPDWYMGFLDGAVRIMPPLEWNFWGHTVTFSILIPTLVVPGIMFTALLLYPWIEQFVTGDQAVHHILDRPRNQPTRTALGAMGIVFYLSLLFAGGNDIIATQFHLSINDLIWTFRVLVFVLPPAAFLITRKVCTGLQQRDKDLVLHGRESNIIRQSADGMFSEAHVPIDREKMYELTQFVDQRPVELDSEVDENGVLRPNARKERLRARMSSFYFRHNVPQVTGAELTESWAHQGGHAELTDHGADLALPGTDSDADVGSGGSGLVAPQSSDRPTVGAPSRKK